MTLTAAEQEFRSDLKLNGTLGVLGTLADDTHEIAVAAFLAGWRASRVGGYHADLSSQQAIAQLRDQLAARPTADQSS